MVNFEITGHRHLNTLYIKAKYEVNNEIKFSVKMLHDRLGTWINKWHCLWSMHIELIWSCLLGWKIILKVDIFLSSPYVKTHRSFVSLKWNNYDSKYSCVYNVFKQISHLQHWKCKLLGTEKSQYNIEISQYNITYNCKKVKESDEDYL